MILSSLQIGSLALSPVFDPQETEYTAATTNATNTITAEAVHPEATVAITVNGTAHTNGTAATWNAGENTVVITVTYGAATATYTIIVTKS